MSLAASCRITTTYDCMTSSQSLSGSCAAHSTTHRQNMQSQFTTARCIWFRNCCGLVALYDIACKCTGSGWPNARTWFCRTFLSNCMNRAGLRKYRATIKKSIYSIRGTSSFIFRVYAPVIESKIGIDKYVFSFTHCITCHSKSNYFA